MPVDTQKMLAEVSGGDGLRDQHFWLLMLELVHKSEMNFKNMFSRDSPGKKPYLENNVCKWEKEWRKSGIWAFAIFSSLFCFQEGVSNPCC